MSGGDVAATSPAADKAGANTQGVAESRSAARAHDNFRMPHVLHNATKPGLRQTKKRGVDEAPRQLRKTGQKCGMHKNRMAEKNMHCNRIF